MIEKQSTEELISLYKILTEYLEYLNNELKKVTEVSNNER